ncbi:MAG: rRNA maturation RNase YbeY [Lachnospiraceae bacterium]|nr:rRNA maturation RNase YbeY [Lachnospiraceae bacterium]MBR2995679.1 rRNA maturation RNase YbeY [Lachnospiraceae bacterium]
MGKVHIITVRNVPWDGEFSLTVTARQVVREVLRLEACPYDVQVGLTLTDDDEIRELNRTYREIDRATDVLSFPNLSLPQPSCFTAAQEDPAGAFDPETGELMLGDIVISKPHMEQQAADYGHSLKREFAFLVAHSTLHLCGYDHMTEEEARVMEQKQETALQNLGIRRE